MVYLKFGEKTVLSDSNIDGTWIDFVRGAHIIWQRKDAQLKVLDIAVTSSIPTGLDYLHQPLLIALLRALCQMVGLQLSATKIAKMGQLIEHNFIGILCGIMDQMSSSKTNWSGSILRL